MMNIFTFQEKGWVGGGGGISNVSLRQDALNLSPVKTQKLVFL